MRCSPRIIIPLLLTLAVLLAADGGTDRAQAHPRERIDLAVEVDSTDYQGINTNTGNWIITATNHGSEAAYGVTVRIELPEQVLYLLSTVVWEVVDTEPLTVIWRIGTLEAGSSVVRYIKVDKAEGVELVGQFPTGLAVPARSVISNSYPLEPERLLDNNTDDGWILIAEFFGSVGRASVSRIAYPIIDLDNPLPQDGDTVNIDFTARHGAPPGSYSLIYGLRLRIQLPPGLGVPAADLPLSAGVSISTFIPVPGQENQWDWVVPYVSGNPTMSLSVPVTDSAALLGGCVTAELTVERPGDDPSDNLARECFQEFPPTLFTTGETNLFTLYPCVGVRVYPCTSEDTLEVVAVGGSAATNAGIQSAAAVMRPDNIVIQVKDPEGRAVLENGVEWQTRADRRVLSGVQVRESVDEIATPKTGGGNELSTDWTAYTDRIRATGIGGREKPGYLKLWNVEGTFLLASADPPTPSEMGDPSYYEVDDEGYYKYPFDVGGDSGAQTAPIMVAFGDLGTYIAEKSYRVTHNGTRYTATGTYTFHVGPVAELEVREGVPDGRRQFARGEVAHVIEAANHGPDTAGGVQVTIENWDPDWDVEVTPTAGTFDPATGIWDIGELVVSGHRTEMLAISDLPPSALLTAGIVSTEDYTVCIGTRRAQQIAYDVLPKPANQAACEATSGHSWHTARYLDYIKDNNTATIGQREAEGEAATLKRPEDHVAAVALRWNAVAEIMTWPVTHYEVQASEDGVGGWWTLVDEVKHTYYTDVTVAPGERRFYRVRPISAQLIPGLWSVPMSSETEPIGPPRGINLSDRSVVLSESGDPNQGGTASYSVSLQSEPTGLVTVDVVSDDSDIAKVGQDPLRFHRGNWEDPQTVTVTGVDDDISNEGGQRETVIRHTARGGGYGGDAPPLPTVAVTVTDDEGGPGVSIAPAQVTVLEKGASATYNVVLSARPAGDVTIEVASADASVATVYPVQLTFTPDDWKFAQGVKVTGEDDEVHNLDRRRTTTITHRVSGGGYDDVTAADVTVIVQDDDVADIFVTESAVINGVTMPEGQMRQYQVRLLARPTGDVTVTIASDDPDVATAVADDGGDTLTFIPDEWNQDQRVRVFGYDNNVKDLDAPRKTTITHTATGGGYGVITGPSVTATVNDNDTVEVKVPPQPLVVFTGGHAAKTYNVRLGTRPTSDVDVTITSDHPTRATATADDGGDTLTFTPGNWQQNQPVRVTGQSAAGTAVITHSATSNDPNYHEIGIAVVNVTVQQFIKPTVTIVAPDRCLQGGDTATFTVSTGHKLAEPLTVHYSVGSNWRAAGSDGGKKTILAGRNSADIPVTTTNPWPGDYDADNNPEGRQRQSGRPGSVHVLLQANDAYDRGNISVSADVYHSGERNPCN